jgi:hypothetical protein
MSVIQCYQVRIHKEDIAKTTGVSAYGLRGHGDAPLPRQRRECAAEEGWLG